MNGYCQWFPYFHNSPIEFQKSTGTSTVERDSPSTLKILSPNTDAMDSRRKDPSGEASVKERLIEYGPSYLSQSY